MSIDQERESDRLAAATPPYSSDDNPIEELWSKFKGKLRTIGARTKEHLDEAIDDALDQVTVKDILG